jgi:hypothetical protein
VPHYLVVVKCVIKRDAKLPRPYPGVDEMADAKDMSIAWPYKRVINTTCHCWMHHAIY